MTRPKCCRKIASLPDVRQYQPEGKNASQTEEVILSLDELEAVRLADYEGLYQELSAEKMGISRQTFGRIIETAHKKIADVILHGKVLKIEGGTVSLGNSKMQKCITCNHLLEKKCDKNGKKECPRCTINKRKIK
jgi:predicted DNA-binding protein (UPF0251 family)